MRQITEGTDLERLAQKMGPEVVAAADLLAREVAEDTGLPPERCQRGALLLSPAIADLRGVDVTLDPGRLHDCPVCADTGWKIVEREGMSSGVSPCPSCPKGLTLEAADWLNLVHPIGRGGKRYENWRGRQQFDKAMRHLPTRRERLIDAMTEMLAKDGAKPPKGWE